MGWDPVFSFDMPEASFAGLKIAPGPLFYDGEKYDIKDNWNYTSYNGAHGKTTGSTYFSYVDMGQLFEKTDFSASDGDIDNLLNPLAGWRLATKDEWESIIGISRSGSTVNSIAAKHYAYIQLTGVSYKNISNPKGVLLFPDGGNITGKVLSGTDNTTVTTGVTVSELNVYLSQGCVFFPYAGSYLSGEGWGGINSTIFLNTSSNYNTYYFYFVQFNSTKLYIRNDSLSKSGDASSVRLVHD